MTYAWTHLSGLRFTLECKTTATRIDRIHTKIGGHIELRFDTVSYLFTVVVGVLKYLPFTFLSDWGAHSNCMVASTALCSVIRGASGNMIKRSICFRYPPNSYGWEAIVRMTAVRDLLLHMQGSTCEWGTATLMKQTLLKISKEDSIPSEQRKEV